MLWLLMLPLLLFLLSIYDYHRETNDIFLVECPGGKRTREVLEPIISKHVAPGTHIITDGWKAYRHLEEKGLFFFRMFSLYVLCLGYKWSWVNHDRHYVDPETGDHTNKIESSWFQASLFLSLSGRNHLLKNSPFSLNL